MDFKKIRREKKLKLKQVAALSGWSIGTISDLEREGAGSDRLKEKLLEIYGIRNQSTGCPNCAALRHRAEAAEAELETLKKKLRGLFLTA